jgi:hypothetical protein
MTTVRASGLYAPEPSWEVNNSEHVLGAGVRNATFSDSCPRSYAATLFVCAPHLHRQDGAPRAFVFGTAATFTKVRVC